MRVLYIAYWGLREPLGQSLILPAVREMARRGVAVDLITFEKRHDLADAFGVEGLRRELAAVGVRWRALVYHKRPTIPATGYDVLRGIGAGLRSAAGRRPQILHGRTFIGGVIALLVRWLTRVRCVYHNEGFWPDQQVEGEFWAKGSLIYAFTKAIEQALYQRADGLILLSHRSRPIVEALPGVRRRRPPLVVVPSCVDLVRFCCPPRGSGGRGLRLIYLGNLGGRYPVEALGRFLRAVRRGDGSAGLTVLSQSDAETIRRGLLSAGNPPLSFEVSRVPHADVPRYLCEADAGVFFLKGGIGAESCSPTKVGEYWASGIPVVSSPGIGDTEEVIRERRVGVIVADLAPDGMETAAAELSELLKDPGLHERCQRAAADFYSLERGVSDQLALYRRVLDPERAAVRTRDS